MATRKTTAPVTQEAENEVLTEATEQEATEASEQATTMAADPWDEQVTMIVPRKGRGEDQQYYVCVNDRRFSIPANGKMQSLPRPVAEVLEQSLISEAEAEEYAASMPNKTAQQAEI